MKITALELGCLSAARQRAFYAGALGLPVLDESEEHFTLKVGHSELTFRQDWAASGYHLAFNVRPQHLTQVLEWVRQRTPVLHQDGQEIFTAQAAWNAQMFYFRDPEDNILEGVARFRLPAFAASEAQPFVSVSEVGYVVRDVSASVARLQSELGLGMLGESSASFAPLGDDDGLLIVVHEGRPWFPTAQAAVPGPLRMRLADTRPALFSPDPITQIHAD